MTRLLNGADRQAGKQIEHEDKLRQADVCSRLMISWLAQYYSNHGGKLLQTHTGITPGSVETGWEFVDGERTGQSGKDMRRLITPICFEITPILVKINWESLDDKKTVWLALAFPQLKYIIIPLQEWRNVKLLQSDFIEHTKLEDSIGGRGKGPCKTNN